MKGRTCSRFGAWLSCERSGAVARSPHGSGRSRRVHHGPAADGTRPARGLGRARGGRRALSGLGRDLGLSGSDEHLAASRTRRHPARRPRGLSTNRTEPRDRDGLSRKAARGVAAIARRRATTPRMGPDRPRATGEVYRQTFSPRRWPLRRCRLPAARKSLLERPKTFEPGGTELTSHTLPPITEPRADHRVAAEDGGAGVDRDVVLEGRVALASLALARRRGAATLSAPSVTPW